MYRSILIPNAIPTLIFIVYSQKKAMAGLLALTAF
jgi:hypothetical protein